MKLEFLTGYLAERNVNINSLKMYYDFSGISGFFVPNNLYKDKQQFAQVPGGFTVNSEYYPGVFVSCYQDSIFTGSGIFNGETNLKVLNPLSGNNISLLYNFGQLNCNSSFTINSRQMQIPTGKIQVLTYIEPKDVNSSTPFEIILGLNDAYKLTLEFSGRINGSVETYKSTNFGELAFQNAGGLRLNNRNIEFSYFDIIEDEIYNNLINLTGSYFNQEKNIYLGNIPTGKLKKGYTGFIGNLDDFLAFDEYYDQKFCASIADIFIKTGDGIEILDVTGVNYNIIQSGFLNPTGILGTGITGYQLVPSDNVINADCGSSCVVYVNSGVTGLITGEKIEYKIVGQQQYTTTQQTIKYNLYDQDYASKFTKNYIVFTPKLDEQDIFDIQVYADVDTTVSQPTYALINQYYITQDLLTDRELLIFLNGVNIPSGNYEVIGNDYKFIIKDNNRIDTDLTLYSVSQFGSVNQTNINYTGQDLENFITKINLTSASFPEINGIYSRSSGYHATFFGPLNQNIIPPPEPMAIWWSEDDQYWIFSYNGEGDLEKDWGSTDLVNWFPIVVSPADGVSQFNYLIEGTVNMFLNGQKLINNYNYNTNLPYEINLENWYPDNGSLDINGKYDYLYNTLVDSPPYPTTNAYKHISLNSWIYFDGSKWTLSTNSDSDQWTNLSTDPNILPLVGWAATNAYGDPGIIYASNILNKDTIPVTGNLYIIQDKYTSEITGSNVKYYNPTGKYNNERIWLNGIFQNKNENYILTSCRNNMLLPSGDIEIKNETIFNNEYDRFNL
jgi:hypothetical protein